MEQIDTVQFLEAVFTILEDKGKGNDLADLLIELNVPAPSLLNDLLTELALAANPAEEVGVGCLSLSKLREMLKQYKQDI